VKITKKDQIVLLQVLYSGFIAIGFSYLIGLATSADALLIAAIPLGILLVISYAWLNPKAQLISWSVATGWLLSSVYLGTSNLEYGALLVVVLAAIAGVVWSPWFLAGIWFVHPIWDLIPRDLPEHQHDLPLACLMYDLVVAIYLAWRIRSGFFRDAVVQPNKDTRFISTGWSRILVSAYVLIVIAIEITVVGMVSMEGYSQIAAVIVSISLIAALLWLPIDVQRIFWMAFTIWTGMTFAHSGELLEILVFFAMIALAIAGFRVNAFYWVIAWTLHAVWNLVPRDHVMSSSSLMGHWMDPMAGYTFEIIIALYLVLFTRKIRSRQLQTL
jgi:hypothetical protein